MFHFDRVSSCPPEKAALFTLRGCLSCSAEVAADGEDQKRRSVPHQTQAGELGVAGSPQSYSSSQGEKALTALSRQHLRLIVLPTCPPNQHLASGDQTA